MILASGGDGSRAIRYFLDALAANKDQLVLSNGVALPVDDYSGPNNRQSCSRR